MNRKTLVLPVMVGMLAPFLAACGGSDAAEGKDPIVVGTTDQFAAVAEAPAPFDPAQSYDAASWNILRNTFQTLMRLPRSGGDPVPEAATRCGFAAGARHAGQALRAADARDAARSGSAGRAGIEHDAPGPQGRGARTFGAAAGFLGSDMGLGPR